MIDTATDPVAAVLERLEGVKQRGNYWEAKCPSHADRHASLTIKRGDKGAVVKCHAGCTFASIAQSLGMQQRDFFTPKINGNGHHANSKPATTPKTYPDFGAATQAGERFTAGRFVKHWSYHDPESREVFRVARFNLADGNKKCLPFRLVAGGWQMGDPAGPLPLYRLAELSDGDPVFICEGEKAADAAVSIGLAATTSAHGAEAARKSDWRPIAGRDVVILPDADEPGEKYAADVVGIVTALTPPARVKIVRLPNLPPHGDMVEYINAGGSADTLMRLVEETPAWRPKNQVETALDISPRQIQNWKPARLSQQANAERLTAELNDIARWNHSRGEWMVYNEREGRLVMDETGFVERAAKTVARQTWAFVSEPPDGSDHKTAFKHAIDSEKSAGIAAMMRLARTEPKISIVASDLDRDQYLFNHLTGVLDLRTGTSREHRRSDLFSKLAPVCFDNRAKCPRFESFMHRIMDGNEQKIRYLQRIAGLCLSGDASVQELFICWGGGANGKSVFLDTLMGMMGDYAGIAPDSLLTARSQAEHPTEIADLFGKRCVVASETEEGAKLRVQLVKRLTGDATIKGRFMRCDFVERPRTHKLILMTNNRPQIRETTNAVWRRVRLIPFTVTIPEAERDPQLLAKLRAEWSGILNWSVRGFLDFQTNGMQTPSDVTIATQEYQADQDPLAEYIAERCIIDQQARVCRNAIYSDYSSWAKAAGEGPDRNSFYDRLRRVPGVSETMVRISGRPTRVFTGIGLADLSTQYQQASERIGGVTP